MRLLDLKTCVAINIKIDLLAQKKIFRNFENLLTIKFDCSVRITEWIFTDALISAKIILTNWINCQFHDYFVSILHFHRLKSLSCKTKKGFKSFSKNKDLNSINKFSYKHPLRKYNGPLRILFWGQKKIPFHESR